MKIVESSTRWQYLLKLWPQLYQRDVFMQLLVVQTLLKTLYHHTQPLSPCSSPCVPACVGSVGAITGGLTIFVNGRGQPHGFFLAGFPRVSQVYTLSYKPLTSNTKRFNFSLKAEEFSGSKQSMAEQTGSESCMFCPVWDRYRLGCSVRQIERLNGQKQPVLHSSEKPGALKGC